MKSDRPQGNPGGGLGQGMIYAAWILALGLLTMFFNGVLERQHNPNREVQAEADKEGVAEVVLQRNRAGHYVADGRINGRPVVFLLDTGATDVAVPESLAMRLGLIKGRTVVSQTANGRVIGWATRLDSVDLGGIKLNDVSASILPNMGTDEILLGMSYLKEVDLIQQGDQLTLRKPARS